MTKNYDTDKSREKRNGKRGIVLMLCLFFLFCGCANTGTASKTNIYEKPSGTEVIVTDYNSYDSADTALLMKRDKDAGTMTFLNLTLGKTYTLHYDGTTKITNKYSEGISVDQIENGTLVDILFYKPRKRLTSLMLSKESFTLNDIEKYTCDPVKKEVTVGSDVYKMADCLKILSEERELELMDINESDILNIQGIENTIYSMVVKKGHGYLRLVNDENFIGGFIEIGQAKIYRIQEDMLMTVPEGNYQVAISCGASTGTKQVTIHRNRETTLDIGDIEVVQPQSGVVIFSLTPGDATVFIDGEQADVTGPVTLEYGLHQLIVKREGYASVTQYLRVGQASAGIDVVLESLSEEDETGDSEAEDGDDDTEITEVDASGSANTVYIDTPEGAEVYLDGNLIGISPCSFKKDPGSHVLVFRKSGYETRSYTIQIDNEERDITYSFAALVPLGT